MEVKETSFRIGVLAIGLAGLLATALLSSISATAIVFGFLFGAGGWLIDYVTRFRLLRGQLSGLALAVGGMAVLLSMRGDMMNDTIGIRYYTVPLQYISLVLTCWGILMYVLPRRSHEP